MVSSFYPAALENAWLQAWRRHIGQEVLADADWRDMERRVAGLSDSFTRERAAGIAAYDGSAVELLAYGLFFFPQNYARCVFALDEGLARAGITSRPTTTPLRVLDLGAGTGAGTCALLTVLAHGGQRSNVLALDKSEASLNQLVRLFRETQPVLWPGACLHTWKGDLLDPPADAAGPWDVILSSYALNEVWQNQPDAVWQRWLERRLADLSPTGCLVLCEPIVQSSPHRLEKLRDWVLEQKLALIAGPCLHTQPCPLLAAGDGWCHDVRRWHAPDSLCRLNRHLFRDVGLLKFSWLALCRNAPAYGPATAETARLVAPVMERKGKLDFTGCAADGCVHRYDVLTRHIPRDQEKEILALERGDVVRWGALRLLGDGQTWRSDAVVKT